ncbi:MAG: YggS family pyridoxal phosphate-dependent enzyme [Actinomycetota bacterium]|nr:YggS family pyridoxal phosphate-dependent enzyme [Actinomycetota bacterium]
MADQLSRRDELAANLAQVRARIDAACDAASRSHDDVVLVAVTKTWPTSDAVLLRDLGVTDLAENRDQEAAEKAAEVTGVRWHFVGQLQTNKARSVARYADVVHAVDRDQLVDALAAGALRAGREVEALVQVSLDGDPDRGGAQPDHVAALADRVAAADGLRLGGVMAVAPLDISAREAFARLAAAAAEVRAAHPDAGVISAGMSDDLEDAIAAGATHVRVGSAILGSRRGYLG